VNQLLENPLFLPKGSVRAILAIGLVAGTIYLCLTKPAEIPEGLLTLTSAVVAFYFGAKK